jgi:hypothetical protein
MSLNASATMAPLALPWTSMYSVSMPKSGGQQYVYFSAPGKVRCTLIQDLL